MGILESRQRVPSMCVSRRRWVLVLWLVGVSLLVLMVRDYWRVERRYELLRFEWAHIKTPPAVEPDLLLLTQWRDFFQLAKLEPTHGMSDDQLRWLENTAALYPSAGFIQRTAVALAWNKRPQDAALWLRRLCHIAPQSQCDAVRAAWTKQAATDPLIAAIPWPQ